MNSKIFINVILKKESDLFGKINPEILASRSRVSTTVWLHHLDFKEMLGEKARWKLHEDAVCCWEKIPEATLYKTAAVRSLIYHIKRQSK